MPAGLIRVRSEQPRGAPYKLQDMKNFAFVGWTTRQAIMPPECQLADARRIWIASVDNLDSERFLKAHDQLRRRRGLSG